jgi:hypothetical protein
MPASFFTLTRRMSKNIILIFPPLPAGNLAESGSHMLLISRLTLITAPTGCFRIAVPHMRNCQIPAVKLLLLASLIKPGKTHYLPEFSMPHLYIFLGLMIIALFGSCFIT